MTRTAAVAWLELNTGADPTTQRRHLDRCLKRLQERVRAQGTGATTGQHGLNTTLRLDLRSARAAADLQGVGGEAVRSAA